MSSRKLQQEFDKLQKKVAEGLQLFEEIHDKIANTENPSLKEKLEGDLRKEIKKLQRSRDQVKQWSGDSSNKLDKDVLALTRSRIENAMERFKEVEKISKMKQFSNEGLELQTKLGARGLDEAKKNEAAKYITEVLDELNRQNELLSGEVSQYSHKKKLSSIQATIDDLNQKIERNNLHIGKVELVLRSLENYTLEPTKIEEIRDDLDYYVENNQSSDFVEYDDFYDLLELDESSEGLPPPATTLNDIVPPTVSPKKASLSPAPEEKPSSAVTSAPNAPTTASATKVTGSPAPAKAVAAQPAVVAGSSASRAPPPGLNPAKPPAPIASQSRLTIADELKKKAMTQAAAAAAATSGVAVVTPGATSSHTAPPPQNGSALGSGSMPSRASSSAGPHLSSPLPIMAHEKTNWDSETIPLAQRRLHTPLPFQAISQQLEASLLNCPDSFDLERPRQYNPTNVHPSSVDYPQEPMYELSLATLMKKFDTDTLFFCFYYNEGQNDLAKYNAARELSLRGWIYNAETKQWFSAEKTRPRSAVDTFDASESYKYFDYQSSWLVRRKDNYQFKAESKRTF